MPNHILFLIIFNSFVGYTRGATDQFLQGYGLFHDIWAPIAEVFITLFKLKVRKMFCPPGAF